MPKPKDAKVWNEDLVAALEARYEQSLREGKRNAHTWQKGAGQIAAVRKDIYCFSNGRIANLPNSLSKTVTRLCEDVIRGVKNVYPDGHVPSNGGAGSAAGYGYGVSAVSVASPVRSRGNVIGGVSCTNCGSSDVERHAEAEVFLCTDCGNVIESVGAASYAQPAAGAASAASAQGSNPFSNDNYMRSIKIRGGAFAILMAFHHSQTDVLLKRQIIAEGQKFCDEQIESNYMAGRPHGAWSGIKTLKDHKFITEEGKAQYTDRGWRSAPHKFTLTRDGKMFIDALLTNRPEAEAARRQAAGIGTGARSPFASPDMRVGGSGGAYASPPRYTLNHIPPGAQIIGPIGGDFPISGGMRTHDNVERDRTELEDWLTTAQVGESKLFNVGKDRRLKLHRHCDSLMEERPGLVLTHSSVGEGRSRALTIQLVRMPTDATGAAQKRSYSQSDGFSGYAQASTSSESSAAKRSRTYTPAQNAAMAAIKRQEQAEIAKEDEDMKKALAESARMAASATPKRRHTDNSGVQVIDGYDDEEEAVMQRVMQESLRESERKLPAKNSDKDVVDIADSDDEDDRKMPASGDSARRKIDLSEINDDDDDDDNIIEINGSQDDPIDLLDSQPQVLGGDSSDDDSLPPASGLHSPPLTGKKSSASSAKKALKKKTVNDDSDDDEIVVLENDNGDVHATSFSDEEALKAHIASIRDYVLSVMIDNRERNRNATPRAMRLELARHFVSGPLSAVWPNGWTLAQVEEEKLVYGDFGFSKIHKKTGERQILGISVERKRANDLVQRSYAGDHLTQLRRMLQSCSMAILMIEYDTRLTSSMTAYDAQEREGFDPLDSTITCEEDVYRMFGRALFTSDSIRFIQTKDEQASLRSIGALGLVVTSAPEIPEEKSISKRSISAQALQDLLKQGGIPWRMAQRVARAVGGIDDLTKLYDSCCDDDAKFNLLFHIVSLDGDDQLQGDLNSSPKRWSKAIYRILMDHTNANSGVKLNGEAALLLHKELIEDHGQYLNTLYQHGCTPDEALDRVLSSSACAMSKTSPARSVTIHLTKDQATQYFPSSGNAEAFYKLIIAPDESSKDGPIRLRSVSGCHASKSLLVYEMEGSDLTDIVQNVWESFSDDRNFLGLVDRIAQRIDTQCRMPRRIDGAYQRVLLVCGLSPALDALARKSGYHLETRTVVDMVLANLMIRRNMAVIQAMRKNTEDRVKVVRQLALACLHHGLLTEKHAV